MEIVEKLAAIQDEWVFFEKVDFLNPELKSFSIDTRDFHCLSTEEFSLEQVDLSEYKKRPLEFLLTAEELTQLLNRYYEQSGGEGEWRMFSLSGVGQQRTGNWEMKYIRIFKTSPDLFLICIKDTYNNKRDALYPLSKGLLCCPVEQRYLNHY
jgi:hypothetical protein